MGNPVDLLVYADQADATARLIQQAAGEMARDYNRRKGRSGAFWEGRYHATMVGSQLLWSDHTGTAKTRRLDSARRGC